MRALLTGITGFAGGHLAQVLYEQGDEIFGVARQLRDHLPHLEADVVLLKADLQEPETVEALLSKTQPDVIYHLAAQAFVPKAWADPWGTLENNIRSQVNILQAMVKQRSTARLVVVASDQVYGLVDPASLPVDEQTPFRPNNPYGVSKVTQDVLALQYQQSHHLDIVRVRAFNHIGPRQSPFFVTANFAKQIADIEAHLAEPCIHVGNLEAQRDFTDVKDVAIAYALLARHGVSGEAYNVGRGQAYSIQTILDILLSLTDCDIEVRQDPNRMRPSDVPLIYADNRKLKAQTGWSPQISLEDSLARVLNYWRTQINKS